MRYRIWWMIALWALAVGIAIELQAPEGPGREEAQAAARGATPPLAAQRADRGRG